MDDTVLCRVPVECLNHRSVTASTRGPPCPSSSCWTQPAPETPQRGDHDPPGKPLVGSTHRSRPSTCRRGGDRRSSDRVRRRARKPWGESSTRTYYPSLLVRMSGSCSRGGDRRSSDREAATDLREFLAAASRASGSWSSRNSLSRCRSSRASTWQF